MAALCIVMKNNVFIFNDTNWKQKTGTAMGTPPAPPWATLYFAIFENEFLNEFDSALDFYRRFIDDVLDIFLIDPSRPERFAEFKNAINTRGSRLTWITSDLQTEVVFMDL